MSITDTRHTISLYVANKPGVLNRIALVFGRRGYNIDSLVVSESTDPDYSYMNIVATGEKETLVQIIKQLNKLVDVVSARDYSNEDVIQKELALFKINCPPERRTEVLQIAQTFKAVSEDLTETTLTLMVTGKSEKIDALKVMLATYGILELVRTGKVLISRGDHRTSRN
ncbi:MAG TPA: acetolactate synthase small subunit [Spirochaetia bacterium]|jgi:acetolactate synthase-1/3 small subunit|nr:acetolactate synthase small subunit [Spirochaetia bacterium]